MREVLYALTDEHVLGLIDELADRVQPEGSPVFALLRGAATELRAEAQRGGSLDVADGWLLDAEAVAA